MFFIYQKARAELRKTAETDVLNSNSPFRGSYVYLKFLMFILMTLTGVISGKAQDYRDMGIPPPTEVTSITTTSARFDQVYYHNKSNWCPYYVEDPRIYWSSTVQYPSDNNFGGWDNGGVAFLGGGGRNQTIYRSFTATNLKPDTRYYVRAWQFNYSPGACHERDEYCPYFVTFKTLGVKISSIRLMDDQVNRTSTVRFRVYFNTAITGITKQSNFFKLQQSPSSLGEISSVVYEGGSSYVVTVNVIGARGTIRLDANNVQPGNYHVYDLPYTSGPSYTIDKTEVTSIVPVQLVRNNLEYVNFIVNLSQDLTTLPLSCFTLRSSGDINPQLINIQKYPDASATTASKSWIVTVRNRGIKGTVGLSLTSSAGTNYPIGNVPFVGSPDYIINRTLPNILAYSPQSGYFNSSVTLTGRDFGSTSGSNLVYFGGIKAPVTAESPISITVKVPAGAGFLPLKVINTESGLSDETESEFIKVNPRNDNSYKALNFFQRKDLAANTTVKPVDIISADMNQDGKPDQVYLNIPDYGSASSSVKVNMNTSTGAGNISFAESQVPLGTSAGTFAVNDIDGDGKIDIVAVTNYGNTHLIKIYRNTTANGSNNFSYEAPVIINIEKASFAYKIMLRDIDLDGRPDFILANDLLANDNRGKSITIYKNYSVPGIIYTGPKVEIDGGIRLQWLASGDFNKDGKPDLVMTSFSENKLYILKNRCAPGIVDDLMFEPVQSVTMVASPNSHIAVGDLDDDGYDDVAATNKSSNQISIFRNTSAAATAGAITFASRVVLSAGSDPVDIAISDLNGDKMQDIVVSNPASNNLTLYRHTGIAGISAATFAAEYITGAPLAIVQSIALADYDADGFTDIASANYGSGNVSVYRYIMPPFITSLSKYTEKPGQDITISGTNFNAVAANNIVYFGAVQAVVKTATTTLLTVTVPAGTTYGPVSVTDKTSGLSATSNQRFGLTNADDLLYLSSRNDYPEENAMEQSMIAVDLNSDGIDELVTVAPFTTGSKIIVNRNTTASGAIGKNSFAPSQRLIINGSKNIYSIAAGDIDGDGLKDIVATDYDQNKVWILLNRGGNLVAQSTGYNVGVNPMHVVLADIDNDGKLDIVTANKTAQAATGTISILRNISTGTGAAGFETQFTTAAEGEPYWIAAADLDADGKADIAVTNSKSGNVSVYRNTTTGTVISLGPKQLYTTGTTPYFVTSGDIDGDGKPELLTANRASNTVSVLKNLSATGNITLQGAVNYPAGANPVAIALGDLNADGKPDMAVTSVGDNRLSVYLNKATAGTVDLNSFSTRTQYATAVNPRSVVIADLNNDTRADIAIANREGSSISIFQNIIPPVITNLSPVAGAPGTVVTITGKHFNTTAANNIVYFGATKAIVSSVSADGTSATVTVPSGATYRTVSLLDETTGLSAYSANAFTVTNAETDGSFPYATNFSTGTGSTPNSVVAADLDGDGHTDLASIDPSTGRIYIETNTGDGKISPALFTLKSDLSIPAGSSSMTTADIDGDGKLDMILSNFTNSQIYVLLNTSAPGNISFGAAKSFSTGTNPGSVTVADIDADGKADILTVGKNTNIAYILRNISLIGEAQFESPAAELTVGANPSSIAVRDLNNDGKPEIITVNAGTENNPGNTISVLQNIATPGIISNQSFNLQTTYTVGSKPSRIAVGDIDGDGFADLAVTNAADNNVSVLHNISSSNAVSFDAAVNFTTGKTPQFVVLGDINGDSKLDIAVVNTGDNTVSILKNTATQGSISTSAFAAKQDFGTGKGVNSVAIADLNGDGKAELALANATDGTISILRNMPVPVVTDFSPKSGPSATTVIITGRNFNTDAARNIVFFGATQAAVLSASSTSLSVQVPAGATYMPISVLDAETGLSGFASDQYVLTNPGVTDPELKESSFNAPINVPTQNQPSVVAMSDLDGDGKTDMVVINTQSNNVTVYHNEAADGSVDASSFPVAKSVTLAVGDAPKSITTGDVDGDGKPDLVISNYAGRTLSILRNTSSNGILSFENQVTVNTSSGSNMIAMNDMNGDGKPDIITANAGSSTVSIFRNISTAGNVSFDAAKTDYTLGGAPWWIATGDLNGDGKPELITANNGSNNMSVLVNTAGPGVFTASSFAPAINYATANGSRSVAVGDLDNDGKPELVLANNKANTVSVFYNTTSNGVLSFDANQDFATGDAPFGVSIGDVNGDGKADLVTGNLQSVSVLRNTSSSGSINSSSFAGKVDIRTLSSPQVVAIGDMDRNAASELVIANEYSNNVSIISTRITAKITFDAMANKTYGDADFDPGATSTNTNSPIKYTSSNHEVATIINGKIHITGTGYTDIKASQTAGGAFANAAEVTQRLTVEKATLTVTSLAVSKVYGHENPRYEFNYSGFVNGETEDILDVKPVLKAVTDVTDKTLVEKLTHVGTYPVIVMNDPTDNNYYFAFTGADLTITKAVLTAKADNKSMPSSGTVPPLTITYSGFVGTDTKADIDNEPAASVAITDFDAIEDYTITLTGGSDDNYDFNLVNGTLSVGKILPVLTVIDFPETKTYGDAPYNIQIQSDNENAPLSYFSSDESVATINPSTGQITVKNAGTTIIRVSQQSDNTYAAPEDLYKTLTVNKAELTATLQNAEKVYGQANPPLRIVYTGFVNGENSSVINQPAAATAIETGITPVSRLTPVNGGNPYTIKVLSENEATDDNYTFSYVNADFIIHPAPLSVIAKNYSRPYGDNNPVFGLEYEGFVNGETVNSPGLFTTLPAASSQAVNTSPAGPYPITLNTAVALNYVITPVAGTLTVEQSKINVSVTDLAGSKTMSRNYGQNNPAFKISYSGFKNGETESVLTHPATVADISNSSSAGQYPVVASGAQAANYTFIYEDDSYLTINKINLSVKAKNVSRPYGSDNPAFDFEYTGFVNGDSDAGIDTKPAAVSADRFAGVAGSPYPINVSGGADDNYILVPDNGGQLTVTKAPLLMIADNKARLYGVANPGLTLSYQYFVNGETAATVFGSQPPVLSTTATNNSSGTDANGNRITYPIKFDYVPATANYAITTQNGTMTIGKATLTVTAKPLSRKYGIANPDAFPVEYEGWINGDGISSLKTVPKASAIGTDERSIAGTYPISFITDAESDNYTIVQRDGIMTVEKAPLTIEANAKQKTYGTENPVLDFKYLGLRPFDEISTALSRQPALGTTAVTNSPAGQYDIFFTDNGASSNYEIIGPYSNKLTVIQADPVITFPVISAMVYGDTDKALSVSSNNAEVPLTYTSSNPSVATVDENGVLHITGAGEAVIKAAQAASTNFNAGESTRTVTITKATLTAKAINTSRSYGDENPAFEIEYNGYVYDDASKTDVVTIAPTGSSVASKTSPVGGPYPITLTGGSAANYNIIAPVDAELTITPAILIITIEDKTRTFGDANPALTVVYSGFKNNENENTTGVFTTMPSVSTTATEISPVSTETNTYSITSTTGVAPNYIIPAPIPAILTITPAVLTATADNKSKVYGNENPALTISYSGFKNGENENTSGVFTRALTASTPADQLSPVNTYEIRLSDDAIAPNYTLVSNNGVLTVTKAELTVTANNAEKIYGEENPALTISYSGFKNNETENTAGVLTHANAVTLATKLSGTGVYEINPVGAAAGNYTITNVRGTLTIKKAPVTATADAQSRKYGEENPVLTIAYAGFVNGDTRADIDRLPTAATTAAITSNVGEYAITVNADGLDNNYEIIPVNNKLQVTRAMLIAKADNKSRNYGEDNPELTVTYTGFANNDDASVIDTRPSVTTNATASSPIGDYDITVANAADNNYSFNYVKGAISVGKQPSALTVGEVPSGLKYGDADFTLTAGSSNAAAALVYNSSNTSVAQIADNGNVHITGAGTTTIRVSQPANSAYGAAADVYRTLTVAKAPLTITAQNVEKNYGDDNPDLPLMYEGFVNGETEAVLATGAAATTAAVKTSAIGTYSITASGASSANYAITYIPGTFTVKAVNARISVAAIPEKTYGDADFQVLTTTNNAESAIMYNSSNTSVATVNAAGVVHITGAGSALITVSQDASSNFGQGVNAITMLTVKPKALKVIADNKSKKYGENNPPLTYQYDGLVNGDQPSVVMAGTISTTATQSSAVGTSHTILVSGFSSPNYIVSHQQGILIVNPANSVITFNEIAYKKYGDADFMLNATTTSDGSIRYSINNVNSTVPAASIDPVTGMVHILNPGQATITATVTGSQNYTTAQDVLQRLTVIKGIPVITVTDPGTRSYGDAAFTLEAASQNTATPLLYASNNTDVAKVNAAGLVQITGGGYASITVSQASTANYDAPVPVSITVRVNRLSPSLNLEPFATKTFGNEPFSPVVTGATGEVVYTSSNSRVAVIADGQIVITGVGSATITAIQAETGNYASARSSRNLLVLPAQPVLSFSALETKTYGDADYTINAVSSVAGSVLTYSSSNVAVATISNGRVHITGAGRTTISVSQAASGRYSAAVTEQVLTVNTATLNITADDKIKVEGEVNPAFTVSYSGFVNNESESVLNLQSTATTAADRNTAPGIYPVIAAGAADDNYNFVYNKGNLTILKIARLTFNALPVKTYGDADFKVAATSNNSNAAITYRGDNPDVATVDQYGNVHITGNGVLTITASQEGDRVFTPAQSVTQVLTVNKAMLNITADSKVAVVGTMPVFTVSYNGFVYNETPATLISLATATVTTDGLIAGSYTIKASGASAANYNIRYTDGTLLLATDGLTFLFDEMPVKTYGDADFNPGAYTNTGASIYYTSMNTAVAVIVDNKVKIVGAGTAEIVATVPGLDPSKNMILKRTLLVNKAPQTITFELIPTQERNGTSYEMVATSSSGLPVQFASSNLFVGRVDGKNLNPRSIGTATATASQPGDNNYLPAPDVKQTFEVVDPAGAEMKVPSVISPNGDGINDEFYIEGITNFPNNHVVIVNRNGTKIYEATNYNNGDVSFNGKDFFIGKVSNVQGFLPQGTYFYVIDYSADGGTVKRKTGYFVVKFPGQ